MSDDIFDVEVEEEVEAMKEIEDVDKAEEDELKERAENNKKEEGKENEEEVGGLVENNNEKDVEVVDNNNPIDKIGFGDLNNKPGVVVGKTGTKVSKFPIPKMRFSQNKKELISILTSDVVVVKRHYHEDVGSIFCFGGACCKELGLPDVRYLYPIVVYDTDKKGKPVKSSGNEHGLPNDVEIKVIQLGSGLYEDLNDIDEMHGDMTQLDILVNCKDEQYQRLNFTPAGEARWRKNKAIRKYVYNFWKDNHEYMTDSIARRISEEEFVEKMGLNTIDNQVDDDVDFDDVFNG